MFIIYHHISYLLKSTRRTLCNLILTLCIHWSFATMLSFMMVYDPLILLLNLMIF